MTVNGRYVEIKPRKGVWFMCTLCSSVVFAPEQHDIWHDAVKRSTSMFNVYGSAGLG